MTTDTVDKQATADAGAVRVGGCAKGVGMIAPEPRDDARVRDDRRASWPPTICRRSRPSGSQPRFNALTVDGCTEHERHGAAARERRGGRRPVVVPGSSAWDDLVGAIDEVGESLVSQLIADAEGVTT